MLGTVADRLRGLLGRLDQLFGSAFAYMPLMTTKAPLPKPSAMVRGNSPGISVCTMFVTTNPVALRYPSKAGVDKNVASL